MIKATNWLKLPIETWTPMHPRKIPPFHPFQATWDIRLAYIELDTQKRMRSEWRYRPLQSSGSICL